MAVIKLNNFGGEFPSASARSLPAGAARINSNLLATSAEFKPLLGELVVSNINVSNPKTIRRFAKTLAGQPDIRDFTASWVAIAELLYFAKGQINDDLTERTYYSSEAYPPSVFDNTGFNKRLGVPAPGVPTVSVEITNEYTYDEDANARIRIPGDMEAAVVASATQVRIGTAPDPTATGTTPGWLSHEVASAAGLGVTQTAGDFAFLAPMSGSVIINTDLAYLTGVDFGGKKVTYLGGSHWAVPFAVQGLGFTINGATLAQKFKAIRTPDPQTVRTVGPDFDTATQQFSNTEISTTVQMVVSEYTVDGPAIAPAVRNLEAARAALEQALENYQNKTTLAAMITAFYSKSDVAAEITSAIANFAKEVVSAEVGILTPAANDGGR